ncbi:hypothetical protein BC832DRAFT_386328 [Gaertneriomyces semiglobifer]|nr:hypothetical protein BC832DRAFT_386328 [Gaertneriomyces semiglobifer]
MATLPLAIKNIGAGFDSSQTKRRLESRETRLRSIDRGLDPHSHAISLPSLAPYMGNEIEIAPPNGQVGPPISPTEVSAGILVSPVTKHSRVGSRRQTSMARSVSGFPEELLMQTSLSNMNEANHPLQPSKSVSGDMLSSEHRRVATVNFSYLDKEGNLKEKRSMSMVAPSSRKQYRKRSSDPSLLGHHPPSDGNALDLQLVVARSGPRRASSMKGVSDLAPMLSVPVDVPNSPTESDQAVHSPLEQKEMVDAMSPRADTNENTYNKSQSATTPALTGKPIWKPGGLEADAKKKFVDLRAKARDLAVRARADLMKPGRPRPPASLQEPAPIAVHIEPPKATTLLLPPEENRRARRDSLLLRLATKVASDDTYEPRPLLRPTGTPPGDGGTAPLVLVSPRGRARSSSIEEPPDLQGESEEAPDTKSHRLRTLFVQDFTNLSSYSTTKEDLSMQHNWRDMNAVGVVSSRQLADPYGAVGEAVVHIEDVPGMCWNLFQYLHAPSQNQNSDRPRSVSPSKAGAVLPEDLGAWVVSLMGMLPTHTTETLANAMRTAFKRHLPRLQYLHLKAITGHLHRLCALPKPPLDYHSSIASLFAPLLLPFNYVPPLPGAVAFTSAADRPLSAVSERPGTSGASMSVTPSTRPGTAMTAASRPTTGWKREMPGLLPVPGFRSRMPSIYPESPTIPSTPLLPPNVLMVSSLQNGEEDGQITEMLLNSTRLHTFEKVLPVANKDIDMVNCCPLTAQAAALEFLCRHWERIFVYSVS